MAGIQYTIRGVPEELDTRLRAEARRADMSLNALLLEVLHHATGGQALHRDLDWFIGEAEEEDDAEAKAARRWLDDLPDELM